MNWISKMFLQQMLLLAPDPPGGGGGGGGKDDPKPDEKLAKELSDVKNQNADLIKRLEALEGKKKDPPTDDPDLMKKAEDEKKAKDKKAADEKALEQAIMFNQGSADFMKNNGSVVPKEIEGIFAAAAQETYASQVERASAIKSSIIQTFFKQQSNLDLLTPGLKSELEEFLKLTKTAKEESAQKVWAAVFEPTVEMLKRIKKAEQLNKEDNNQSDVQKSLAERMMKQSKKHYLGEKYES